MGILFIGIGGGLGAISRYLLSELSLRFIPLDYPLGTLAVNVIGCFFIGLYIGNSMPIKDTSYYFFIIGFLGSFTTMSAFTHQTVLMINTNVISAASYIMLTIILTVAATYIGTLISKQ